VPSQDLPAEPAPDKTGESRWPMALAVLAAGGLRAALPPQLRDGDARWAFILVVVVLLAGIIDAVKFSTDANVLLASGGAIWLSNVITFGLWYWDLDRGGAAARARGSGRQPAFVFPEMVNAQYVRPGWYPKFMDYLYLSFTTATAFSPTDVSAIRPWAKLMMMAEEAISLLVAILVVSRAVNILR
jgi:hypothetical protein